MHRHDEMYWSKKMVLQFDLFSTAYIISSLLVYRSSREIWVPTILRLVNIHVPI